jgi:hypothetical protein
MDTGSRGAEVHTDSWDHVSVYRLTRGYARKASMHGSPSASDPCARIHGPGLMTDDISCSMIWSGALTPTNAQTLLSHTGAGRITDEREPLRLTIGDPCLDKKRIKDSSFITAHAAASRLPKWYALPRQSHRRCT